MKTKEDILNFIKQHKVCVLSTIDPNGNPEAAAVEFAETDKFKLIIDTFTTYRKYQNLKNNPKVALVIGWDDATVQYEGVAAEIEEKDEFEKYKTIFLRKYPDATKFFSMPETRMFKISPKWLRLRDYSTDPETVVEITDF